MAVLFAAKGWLVLAGGAVLGSLVSGVVLLSLDIHPFVGVFTSLACVAGIIGAKGASYPSRGGYALPVLGGVVGGILSAALFTLISGVFLTMIGFTDGGHGYGVYKALGLLGLSSGGVSAAVFSVANMRRSRHIQKETSDVQEG